MYEHTTNKTVLGDKLQEKSVGWEKPKLFCNWQETELEWISQQSFETVTIDCERNFKCPPSLLLSLPPSITPSHSLTYSLTRHEGRFQDGNLSLIENPQNKPTPV